MKTFLFKALLVLTTGLAALQPALASELIIEKIPNAHKQLAIRLEGTNSPVSISITEEKGRTLLEKTSTDGTIFDLSRLREGHYTIVVSSSLREIHQPLLITSCDIIIHHYLRKEIFAPVLHVHDNLLDLNWFSSKVSNVSIAITADGGEEIFAESLKNIIRLERRYNLSALKKGTYIVSVTTPDKVYSQHCRLP